MQLSKKPKTSEFFAIFLRSASNFQHFEKKINLITYVFPKLWITKHVLR